MKKIITLLLIVTVAKVSFCQSIERKLVGVNGTTLSNGGYVLSYSIGEAILHKTPDATNSNQFFATIGFQQPHVAKTGRVLHPEQWVSAYPNPAVNFVRIDVHGIFPTNNTVMLTNVLGQSVIVPPFKFVNGSTDINISKLTAGTYIVSVRDELTGNTSSTKIIKQY